ncbi:MAG: hypothetical protein OXC62_08105 [Aestuariivita sp.]|nr:hypothetical protein [Aestuariivita sp.]
MAEQKLFQTLTAKSSDFQGRTFARIPGYMRGTRKILLEEGAEYKGQMYLLPEGKEAGIIEKMDASTLAENQQAMKDRLPVSAAQLEGVKVGDMFDFGGEIGLAQIVRIGGTFTAEKPPAQDVRIVPGDEMRYVYNANAPKSAMAYEPEEVAPAPEVREDEPEMAM